MQRARSFLNQSGLVCGQTVASHKARASDLRFRRPLEYSRSPSRNSDFEGMARGLRPTQRWDEPPGWQGCEGGYVRLDAIGVGGKTCGMSLRVASSQRSRLFGKFCPRSRPRASFSHPDLRAQVPDLPEIGSRGCTIVCLSTSAFPPGIHATPLAPPATE